MSLIYCYSTKSKLWSIEAMLHTYRKEYPLFSWKPQICVVEKINQRWEVFYDEASILKSQEICEEIFFDDNLYVQMVELLNQKIVSLKEDSCMYRNLDIISKAESDYYFDQYSDWLQYYTFSNEFCFRKIEQKMSRMAKGNIHNYDIRDQNFKDTDTYRSYQEIMRMREEYGRIGTICKTELTSFINKYGYLLNRKNQEELEKYLLGLIQNGIQTKPQKVSASRKESNKKFLTKIEKQMSKILEIRRIRLLMRETMMLNNFHFTQLAERSIKNKFGQYITDTEVEWLLYNLSKQDLDHLDHLDIAMIQCRERRTLLYCDGTINYTERTKISPCKKEALVSSAVKSIHGRTIYGSGVLNAQVVSAYTDEKQFAVDKNYVYVTRSLHPKDLIIPDKLAAVVAEEGGILSHASIIAREMKIPCIVNAVDACTLLNHGDIVSIDMENGIIHRLKKEKRLFESDPFEILCKDLNDSKRFGNKCTNLCGLIDTYRVAQGFAISSERVMHLYRAIEEGGQIELSARENSMLNSLFPVIVRSSSLYEDDDEYTGAGLLESVKDANSIEMFQDAITKIVRSSQTKEFEVYTGKNNANVSQMPSIMVQRYYKFAIAGTVYIGSSTYVVEYVIQGKNKHPNYIDKRLSGDEVRAILDSQCVDSTNIVDYVIKNLSSLVKKKREVLVEFGIDRNEFYLLQIRSIRSVEYV